MPRLTIEGGVPLKGTVRASGAKNAALPILSAVLMMDGETILQNVPDLADVNIMLRMLNALGVRAEYYSQSQEIHIMNSKKIRHIAPYDLVTSMRASFFVAGPILAKVGFAKVPLPGGCSIGTRPVDIHLKGFQALGATVSMEHGFVQLQADRLKGAYMRLEFPSVGATENIMMAAALAEGETVIDNAAREPEIDDLAFFLNKAGAQIEGIGSSKITIKGVSTLKGVSPYPIVADRIEAGTLLLAGAITNGDVTVTNLIAEHQLPLLEKLREAGVGVEINGGEIRVFGNGRPKAVDFNTEPFPGFPTDMQAQMMALLTIAEGRSIIKEAIFENRFMHVQELLRMGAQIKIDDQLAIVTGVPTLSGAEVKTTDLRAGAALILAGLVAQGWTSVYGLKHLKRGYDKLPKKLESLGARIIEGAE